MTTIFDAIRANPNHIPKYTRFELAKLVKNKRLNSGETVTEVVKSYGIPETYWESIENASRLFNVKEMNLISDYLGISKGELTAYESDGFENLSYRTKNKYPDATGDIILANEIFNEIIMQYKISTDNIDEVNYD